MPIKWLDLISDKQAFNKQVLAAETLCKGFCKDFGQTDTVSVAVQHFAQQGVGCDSKGWQGFMSA